MGAWGHGGMEAWGVVRIASIIDVSDEQYNLIVVDFTII
jgi:hypothetical protein